MSGRLDFYKTNQPIRCMVFTVFRPFREGFTGILVFGGLCVKLVHSWSVRVLIYFWNTFSSTRGKTIDGCYIVTVKLSLAQRKAVMLL